MVVTTKQKTPTTSSVLGPQSPSGSRVNTALILTAANARSAELVEARTIADLSAAFTVHGEGLVADCCQPQPGRMALRTSKNAFKSSTGDEHGPKDSKSLRCA